MLAQYSNGSGGGGSIAGLIVVYVIIFVAYVVALWKMFEKAGEDGWKAIIPIYNTYIILKIVGRPGWWLILYFIPFVNIVIWIIVSIDLAKSYGKGTGFAVGLIFLSLIFVMILGFGSARYVGPAASGGAMAPPTPPAPPMPA